MRYVFVLEGCLGLSSGIFNGRNHTATLSLVTIVQLMSNYAPGLIFALIQSL